MVIDFDEILLELSYKVDDGIVDLTKSSHRTILAELLQKNGVRNAKQIMDNVFVNATILKEASGQFKPDTGKPLKMDAAKFESYIAEIINIAQANNKKIPKNRQTEKINGVELGHGQDLLDAVHKAKGIPNGNYAKYDPFPTVSGDWKKWTGKSSDTPKTDISGGGNSKLSVKRGSAQLMSPESKELQATFLGAAKLLQIDKQLSADLQQDIDELVKMAGKLLKAHRTDQGMQLGILKKIHNEYDDDVKAYNKDVDSKYQVPIKKLSDHNIEMAELAAKAEKLQKKMVQKVTQLTENNPEFNRAMVYEAASGEVKFDGNPGKADYVLAISGDGKSVKCLNMKGLSSPAVKYMESKIGFQCTLKTTSAKKGGEYLGYNFYASFRISMDDILSEHKVLMETYSLLMRNKHLLTEGILDGIFAKLKQGWDWFLEKLESFWNWIKEAAVRAYQLVKEGFEGCLAVLGVETEVSVSNGGRIEID